MADVTIMSKPGPTQIDTITVDTTLNETHTLQNTVTDHPVETGFNPTDHSRPEPVSLSLECMISNTPISLTQQRRAVKEGSFTFDSTAIQQSLNTEPTSNTPGRMQSAFIALKKLRDEGTIVKVITGLTVYENMAIQTISVTRDAQNSQVLHFGLVLKAIRVVQNKLTAGIKTPKAAKDKNVAKEIKTGNQTPKPVDNRTAAAKAADGYNSSRSNGGSFLQGLGAGGAAAVGL